MKYYTEQDYSQICAWLRRRKMPIVAADSLPEIGLVERSVACGFLIITDTSSAYIDFYISNPEAPKFKVGKALEEITAGLLGHAKRAGISSVHCSTQTESIKKLARSNGFKSVGLFECFTLEVN